MTDTAQTASETRDVDKRVERSRTALVSTLLDLMAEKPYSKISVANICESSGVARPTFYLHFRSKDDLLRFYIEQLFTEFAKQIDPLLSASPHVDPKIAVLMFQQWKDHGAVAKLLVEEGVEAILLNEFKRYVGDIIDRYIEVHNVRIDSAGRLRYVIDYLAGASFSVIVRWVREDFKEDPVMLAELYSELSRPGLVSVMMSGRLL